MNFSIRYIFPFLLAAFMLSAWGCNKGAGEDDYGLYYVYMPQATVSGGLNNHYPVPSGEGKHTYNFRVDEESGKLEVMLGVIRSGTLSAAGFTVDVVVIDNEAAAAVSEGAVTNAEVLPATAYTLPSTVTVGNKTNSASFYLSVDAEVLKSPAYDGKNLILAVGIANPTSYQLSETNISTLVVIDVDAVREFL